MMNFQFFVTFLFLRQINSSKRYTYSEYVWYFGNKLVKRSQQGKLMPKKKLAKFWQPKSGNLHQRSNNEEDEKKKIDTYFIEAHLYFSPGQIAIC